MKKFDFKPGYYHICQLSADKGIIFYSTADILVYYSIVAVRCLKEGIRPIGITIMFNHTHLEAPFRTEKQMVDHMHGCNTSFSKSYNSHHKIKGPVFCKSFNRSRKYGEQKIRDTFVYIGNNGKMKIPSINAEDYRWNFLKYLDSSHPFSEEIDYRTASPALLQLLSEVLGKRSKLQPLNYSFFGNDYKGLCDKERLQLIDFIVSAYFFLDKEKIMSLYGDYQNLCTAINAVSGKEYDFSDDCSSENYRHYYQMMSICNRYSIDVAKLRSFSPPSLRVLRKLKEKNAVSFPFDEIKDPTFRRLASEFRSQIGASDYEIAKFFHLL